MTLVGRTEPNKTSWMDAASEAAGFVALPAAIAHQTVTGLRRWGFTKPTAFLAVSRFLPWVGMVGLITTGWQAVSAAKRIRQEKETAGDSVLLAGALLTLGTIAGGLTGVKRLSSVTALLGSVLDLGHAGYLLLQYHSGKDEVTLGQIAFQLGMILLFGSYQNPSKTFQRYAGKGFEGALLAERKGKLVTTTGAELEFRVEKTATEALGVEGEIFMPHRDTVYHPLRDTIPGAELIPVKQTPYYDFAGRQAKIHYGQQRIFVQPDGGLIVSDVLTGSDSGLLRYQIGKEIARPAYDTRIRYKTRAEVMAESEKQLHQILSQKMGVDVPSLMRMEDPSRRRTYWILKTADGRDHVSFTLEKEELFCTMGEIEAPAAVNGRIACPDVESAEQFLVEQVLGGKVRVRVDSGYEGILIPVPGGSEKVRFGLVRDAYGTFEISPDQTGGVPLSHFQAYEALFSAMEHLHYRGGNRAVPAALQEHVSIPYHDERGEVSIRPLLAVLRKWIGLDDVVAQVIPMEPGRANFCPPLSQEVRRLVWFGRLDRIDPGIAFEKLLVAFLKGHGVKYADCNFSPVAAVALRELVKQRPELRLRFEDIHPELGGRSIQMVLDALKEIPTAEFRPADAMINDLGEDRRIVSAKKTLEILRFYVGVVHRALREEGRA